jgi:hypothetical protein
MFWFLGRILSGLICGALLGAIIAVFVVPRPQTDLRSDISLLEQEETETRRGRWIVGVTAVASATLAVVAGRMNLGSRTEFIAKGALAGAFLAIGLTLGVAQIMGDNPSYRDGHSGRVHALGRTFLLPFLTGTGGVLGWFWHRMRSSPKETEGRNTASDDKPTH